jgi:uncharacterized protein involved in outer membrane biogenesis
VRFVHGGIDLDVVAAATPVEGAAVPAGKNRTSGGEPLSNRISFKGSYQGTAFNGVALTGEFLSFRNSGESFPVRGHVVSGKTRLDIDGSLADMLRISAMDAKVRVAGPSLSTLHPFVAFRPPASRPFDAEGLVRYADAEYAVTQLRGKIGGTTVTGETHYAPRRDEERPLIRATLRSEDANLVDLAPLAAIPDPRAPPAAQPAPGPVVGKQEGKAKRGRAGKAPVRAPAADLPVRVDRLKAIDAHVTLNAAKLRTPDVPALESLRLTVKLDNGMLNLDPLDAGMAGGRVAGSASFDARQETPSAAVTLAGNGLLLEKLVPALPENARIAARMRARVKLSGQGKSFGALLGSASGSVAAMVESGSLSNLADAKLALNRAKILGLLIRGDRDIAINCGAIAFDFHNGRGKSQAILLDTEQTRIAGAGTADLRGRSIDLLLTPEPRKPAIFSLQKSIRLLWPSQDSAVSLVDRVPMAEMKAAPQSITALLRSASNNGEPGGGCAQAFAAAASTDNGRASSGAR